MNRRGFLGTAAALCTVTLVPCEPEPEYTCMVDWQDDGQWMSVIIRDDEGRLIHQYLKRVEWTVSRDGVMTITMKD